MKKIYHMHGRTLTNKSVLFALSNFKSQDGEIFIFNEEKFVILIEDMYFAFFSISENRVNKLLQMIGRNKWHFFSHTKCIVTKSKAHSQIIFGGNSFLFWTYNSL